MISALVVLLIFTASACSMVTKGPSSSGNSSIDAGESSGAGMKDDREMLSSPEAGIALPMPPSYHGFENKVFLDCQGGRVESGLYEYSIWLYPASYEALSAMGDQDFMAAEEKMLVITNLYLASSEWTEEDVIKWMSWVEGIETTGLEKIGEGLGYTLFAYSDTNMPEGLDEELNSIYQTLIDEFAACRKEAVISEPKEEEIALSGSQVVFETTDVDGNAVSSKELFASSSITMINCWASWCGPCIAEMPELQKLYEEISAQGGSIVGVLIDGNESAGLTDGKDILADTGVSYLNILPWEGIEEVIRIQAVPTSFFVDSEGNVVGSAVVGADFERYRAVLDEYLKK